MESKDTAAEDSLTAESINNEINLSSDVKRSSRELGDRLRDIGLKKEAAQAYSDYLSLHPDDFEIWVQRGNCLKDVGYYDEAEVSYSRGISIRPSDFDVFLQLGHLYKLRGDFTNALEAYKRSVTLEPNPSAIAEIRMLGIGPEQYSKWIRPDGESHFYDIDDFFSYLKHHQTMSGIQRVQAGLILALSADLAEVSRQNFVIWHGNYGVECIKVVNRSDLVRFVRQLSSTSMSHSEIKAVVDKLESEAVPFNISAGDTVCVLGAFWNYNNHTSFYARLKSEGVIIGVYIYDIIPVTHPEYCDEQLTRNFVLSLGDVFAIFDFIITISEFTASEVRRIIKQCGIKEIPIRSVPLAHVLTEPNPSYRSVISERIAIYKGRNYALFVSTIEGRKNHALLVAAWRAMLDEGLNPPDLVFVGRMGWRVETLFDILQSTDYLDGRIHVLNDLSDVELTSIYEWCRFTIFPSFVEGWGLPVGESLVAGRPCLASSTSSIPEVGGDFVEYIDPFNLNAAMPSIKKYCFDDAFIASQVKKITNEFVQRDWSHVGNDFLNATVQLSDYCRSRPRSIAYPVLEEGHFFSPGSLVSKIRAKQYFEKPFRTILQESWYAPEEFGVWMMGQRGTLRIQTTLAPFEEVIVILKLVQAPWADEAQIQCTVGDVYDPKAWINGFGERPLRAAGRVDANSALSIEIQLRKEPASSLEDSRKIAVGLTDICYVSSNNLIGRLELLERVIYL